MTIAIRLADLAVRHGCELRGDPELEVNCVGTLQRAKPGAIGFLANRAYRTYLADTAASAVILAAEDADNCPVACLITANPYAVYARIATELYPVAKLNPGVHAQAVCDSSSVVAATAEVCAGAVIGANVVIGERVYIGPNCVVSGDVSIGADTRLVANVTLLPNVRIGERCIMHAGVVIGSDGFGIAQSESGWLKVPQVGGVLIGNDVEIGANSTVDRGAVEDTRLENDVRIDNLCQIGHNVCIGEHTAMAAHVGIAGSVRIGARCMIGGNTAISGHLEITDDVYLHGNSGVTKDIKVPGVYSSALAVQEAGKWRRLVGRLKRLDITANKIKEIELILKRLDK